MLETKNEWIKYEYMEWERSGERRGCYNELRYDLSGVYWRNRMNVHRISMIMKIRKALLDLNMNEG